MLRVSFVLRFFAHFAFVLACSWLALLVAEGRAHAFEKQWHLGGGLGGTLAQGYRVGPALNAYAAYGVSDVFDLRLEAIAAPATHAEKDAEPHPKAHTDHGTLLYGAKLALAYKIDVIEWIPYAGPSVGFLGVTSPTAPYESVRPTVGGLVGLDYAMSRDFGLGVAGFYDYAFRGGANAVSLFLRAEFHFGY